MYTFPSKVTTNTYLISFQYKILNNVLHLNKNLHTFSLIKHTSHLFYNYTHIQDIWNQVQAYFTDSLHFLKLTPQTTFLAFITVHNSFHDSFLIQNYILLLLKLHIYNAKKYDFLSFNNFLNEIIKIKNLGRRVALNKWNKCEKFRKKWYRIENKVP